MKLELNIKEDKELRDFVKDLIRGQIKSIAREEIREIIGEVFKDKHTNISSKNVDALIKAELSEFIRKELLESKGHWGTGSSMLQKMAREILNEEINKLIEKKNLV